MNRTLGDYELLEELGAGGMGTVYRARHASTGVDYALKTLRAGADPELVARFQREGEGQARVDDHPNVVRVRSLARDGATAYLVMDLVTGGSLDARLRRGLPSPGQAAAWVRDLALAVEHAHRQGVLHRDLKPQNVLFDGETPQLTDFGLAKLLDAQSLTETGSLLGTPAYMAPEQVRGQGDAIGPATDVYGLGALLYHCLTGRPPFQGGQLAVLRQVLETPPTSPGSLRPELAPALEAVCLRALAKDPLERYPTASALADALEALLTATPARPGLAAPVALALTLVVALGGLAAALQARSQAPAAASPTTPAATPPRPPAETPTEPRGEDPDAEARRRPCAGLHEYDVAGIRQLNLEGRFAEARQEVLRVLSGPPCREQIYALSELGWAIAFDVEPDLELAEGYMLHAASQGHARACWMLGSLWSTPDLRPSIYDAPTFHPDRQRAAAAIWLADRWAPHIDEHRRALGYLVERRALLPDTEAEARALVLPADLPPLELPPRSIPPGPAALWAQEPDAKSTRVFGPLEQAPSLERLGEAQLEAVEERLRAVLLGLPSRLHPQAYRLASQAELLRRGDTPRMRLLLLRAALLGDAEAASAAFAAYYPWRDDTPLRSKLTLGAELDVALAWFSLASSWSTEPTHRANLKVALASVDGDGHELPDPAQAYRTVWERFPEAR